MTGWAGSTRRFVIGLALAALVWDFQPVAAASPKISPVLNATLDRLSAAGVTRDTAGSHDLQQFSTRLVRVDAEGRIHVQIHVGRLDDASVRELESAGVVVELTDTDYRVVQGWVPFDALDGVARIANVQRIRPPSYATPRGRMGSTRQEEGSRRSQSSR